MAAEAIVKREQAFDYKSYSDLDNCPELDYLLKATHLMASLPGVVKIKLDAIRKLELSAGDQVLEAGCGLGYDAERMQNIVGQTGKVFAVDASKKIISLAKEKNSNSKVNYIQDAPPPYNFPDNHFSAIYVDRLLVSQTDVAAHFSEFYRMLKPGGRIVLVDLDFETIFIYPTQNGLTDRLVQRLGKEMVRNPIIGRELHHYLKTFNFKEVTTEPHVYLVDDFELLTQMFNIPRILNDMVHCNEYTEQEKQMILNGFYTASKEKNFIYGLTLFTAFATK